MEQGTVQKESQPRDIFDLDYPHRELDENVKVLSKFRADTSKEKCYLNYTYKTEDMTFYTFQSIRKAENLVMNDPQTAETSIRGYPAYIEACERLLFSHSPKLVQEQRIAGVQTVSGTEALRLGFEFIKANIPAKVYVPHPSYGNHIPIPEACDLEVLTYSYVQHGADKIDWKSFNHTLSTAEKNSIFLLQPFCQNPTGIDPTLNEWRSIAQIMKQRGLIPFFDVSFLGMMTANIDEDNLVLQIFLNEGLQIMIAHSFSKIMSLYGERIGVLLVVCSTTEIAQRVQGQLEEEVINLHGGSPLYPARLVTAVLTTPELFEEWKEELKGVYNRVAEIRKKLVDALSDFGNDRNWKAIARQKGFFTLLPLTPEECGTLVDKHHIYLLSNGRISLGALNDEKIALVKEGIKKLLAAKNS